eukprot:m.352181 g.352181  ORF g.352181 m.352181 type:complete len:57 (-) comp16581_c2_seq8:2085-2255(-)
MKWWVCQSVRTKMKGGGVREQGDGLGGGACSESQTTCYIDFRPPALPPLTPSFIEL